jgi:hypothetical protein
MDGSNGVEGVDEVDIEIDGKEDEWLEGGREMRSSKILSSLIAALNTVRISSRRLRVSLG